MNDSDQELMRRLEGAERDAGLEYVGGGMNRAERRRMAQLVQRLTRRPDSWQTLHVRGEADLPLSPAGVRRLAKRRRAAMLGAVSRKGNQRKARQ